MYEVVKDSLIRDGWRAERIDGNGWCYIAIFSGPGAHEAATEYAAWKNETVPQCLTTRSISS